MGIETSNPNDIPKGIDMSVCGTSTFHPVVSVAASLELELDTRMEG
jgi:hypothetical protein